MLNPTEKLLFHRELERLREQAASTPNEYNTYRSYISKQITLLETVLDSQ